MNRLNEVGSPRGEGTAPGDAPAAVARTNSDRRDEGDAASRDAERASLARALEGAVLAGRWGLAERLAELLAKT